MEFGNGDVETAFLLGDKQEGQRDVYVEPAKDVAEVLVLTPEQIRMLEGSVYGLIVAPCRWHFRVQTDVRARRWRQHQLDPCLYMKYGASGIGVGTIGVYMDDFTMALSGCAAGQECREGARNMYTWGA